MKSEKKLKDLVDQLNKLSNAIKNDKTCDDENCECKEINRFINKSVIDMLNGFETLRKNDCLEAANVTSIIAYIIFSLANNLCHDDHGETGVFYILNSIVIEMLNTENNMITKNILSDCVQTSQSH